MEAIDVKGTIAFVSSDFTAARAEKFAASEMTTEWIWFVSLFTCSHYLCHRKINGLTPGPFASRKRAAAALADTVIVV
jgi:hypothetical protein